MDDVAAIIVGVMMFTFMAFRNEWLACLINHRKQVQKGAAGTESPDEEPTSQLFWILVSWISKAALSGLAGFVATKFLIIPLAAGALGGVSEGGVETITIILAIIGLGLGGLSGDEILTGAGCLIGAIIGWALGSFLFYTLIPLVGWTTTNVAAPGGALIVAVAAVYGCFVGVLTVYRTVKQDVHR